MKRLVIILAAICMATVSLAGFKAKNIKPKKPDKFQISATLSGVTFAADLVLSSKEQQEYFQKALTPGRIIAVRLAIFNNSRNEVLMPIEGIHLISPDGKELPLLAPEEVAKAVLRNPAPDSKSDEPPPVKVATGPKVVGSRTDKTNPNYDPRLDPTDPRYDPSDPRNTGRTGTYGSPRIVPGIDVILNPSVDDGNKEEISAVLIEKDFVDKAYAADPVLPSMTRDRFLYFSIGNLPKGINGFELRLTQGRGVSQDVILIF
jgi:hypothetical protein